MSPSVSIKKLECDKCIVPNNAFAKSVKYTHLRLHVLVYTFRLNFPLCSLSVVITVKLLQYAPIINNNTQMLSKVQIYTVYIILLVTLKADNLIINGNKYTVDTLDQLTGELSMRTFCERSNDRILVVRGIFSSFHPLSNYYHADFVFRNQKYSNIEQAFQHVKAVLFGEHAAAAEILSSDDPAAAEMMSFSIKGFKERV